MSDLVHAILDDPESDAPRLVYADHLAERGDPRGELISLQIAQHRGHASDAVRQRVSELIDACWSELSRVPKAAGAQRFCVRRGFVEGLRLEATALSELPTIMESAPVLEIEVCGARDGVQQLANMREALRLRVLKLVGLGLGNKRFIALLRAGAFANLRELDIRGNGLGEPAVSALIRALAHMPSLETVHLESDKLGEHAGDPLFELRNACVDDGVWFP